MTPVTQNKKLRVQLLRVKLWRDGTDVKMQVLKQHMDGSVALRSGEMTIRSVEYPELVGNTLYVRGDNKDRDKWIATRKCYTEEYAQSYLLKCQQALRTAYLVT